MYFLQIFISILLLLTVFECGKVLGWGGKSVGGEGKRRGGIRK